MMKMCAIIKELRAIERYGDKTEQTIAKRMLNCLYGEQHNDTDSIKEEQNGNNI